MQSKILTYPLDNSTNLSGCVLVGGCFDLLHFGHLNFLKSASKLGPLVIALESDDSIRKRKKDAPIHTQDQRAEILAELCCVDSIILLPLLQTYKDYLALVQMVNPSILAITAGDPQTENKLRQAETINAKVIKVNNIIDGLSSSIIRAKHL